MLVVKTNDYFASSSDGTDQFDRLPAIIEVDFLSKQAVL